MDWPAWIGATAAVATLAYLTWAIGHAKRALADGRKTRHGQLILDIGTAWSSPEIGESRELLAQRSGPGMVALVDSLFGPNPLHAPAQRATALDEYTRLARLPYLIELIGVLALEDAITSRVVYTLWAGGILGAWEGWEEAVRQLRIHQKEYEAYVNFEWIANQMKAIHRERREPPD